MATPFRGNYAGVGFEWDEDNNIFWPPKIHSSWVKNTSTARWQSPLGDPPALTAEQQSQNDVKHILGIMFGMNQHIKLTIQLVGT